MRWLGVTAGLGVVLGCTSSSVFICEGDAQCGDGRCEANGFCSFPSSTCEAGWAYGELAAPSLAGACVGEQTTTDTEASTGDASTSTPPTGDTTESTDDTTGEAETTSSSDTGYGYETSYGYAPYYCQAYASALASCYGEDETQYVLMWCTDAYEEYYSQGDYCGYAFVELLACLSSLDCRELSGSSEYCVQEFDTFYGNCNA
jgi:hypothetical protein